MGGTFSPRGGCDETLGAVEPFRGEAARPDLDSRDLVEAAHRTPNIWWVVGLVIFFRPAGRARMSVEARSCSVEVNRIMSERQGVSQGWKTPGFTVENRVVRALNAEVRLSALRRYVVRRAASEEGAGGHGLGGTVQVCPRCFSRVAAVRCGRKAPRGCPARPPRAPAWGLSRQPVDCADARTS